MFEPLTDKPDCTIVHAQVIKFCLRGERPDKTPIFTTGFSDTPTFLAWLRAFYPGSLTAQLKGEVLVVVPSTTDGFRAEISALRPSIGEE